MAEVGQLVAVGEAVWIEFSGQKIPASVIWTREGTAGFKFAHNIDLGELLAGRKPRHGFRPRPPRLEVQCKASIRVGKTYYNCEVRDISLGGMKASRSKNIASARKSSSWSRACVDQGSGAVVSRTARGDRVDEALTLEEMAIGSGKASNGSLKASYKKD